MRGLEGMATRNHHPRGETNLDAKRNFFTGEARPGASKLNMRPRAIQDVPGLDSNATPFERLEKFARMIVRIPKAEADKQVDGPGPAKPNKKRRRFHD